MNELAGKLVGKTPAQEKLMARVKQQPAFPGGLDCGMTLRDYFAIHFAEGLARHAAWSEDSTNEQNVRLAKTAYSLADAMIQARYDSS